MCVCIWSCGRSSWEGMRQCTHCVTVGFSQGANVLLTERGDVKLGLSTTLTLSLTLTHPLCLSHRHTQKQMYKNTFSPTLSWHLFFPSGFWRCSWDQCLSCQEEVLHRHALLVSDLSPSMAPKQGPLSWFTTVIHGQRCSSRMAPEVAAVEKKGGYNQLCDIWAVGITAIELAELQPPMFDLHPMRWGHRCWDVTSHCYNYTD